MSSNLNFETPVSLPFDELILCEQFALLVMSLCIHGECQTFAFASTFLNDGWVHGIFK